MYLLRLGVLIMMVLLGGIGVLLGSFVGFVWLRGGESSYSITVNGVSTKVVANRDTDPNGFWRNLGLYALLPILLGGGATWYGWTRLSR